jgi:hypothetical protein
MMFSRNFMLSYFTSKRAKEAHRKSSSEWIDFKKVFHSLNGIKIERGCVNVEEVLIEANLFSSRISSSVEIDGPIIFDAKQKVESSGWGTYRPVIAATANVAHVKNVFIAEDGFCPSEK